MSFAAEKSSQAAESKMDTAKFDGGYSIEKVPVGHSYTVYAEPLGGAVDLSQISKTIQNLCRNASTDEG